MIILDAIFACIFMKIFGTKCVYVLGVTALLTFLRLSIKMDRSMDLFGVIVEYLFIEDEESENI